MTKAEFLVVLAYLEMACGKKLEPKAVDAYFDLLGHHSAEMLQLSAKRVVLEHPWATFPSIAELNKAAVETSRAQISKTSAAEAWELAWDRVRYTDLEIEYQRDRCLNGLPDLVKKAMLTFGLPALIYGKEPVAVIRAQFMKIYEQLQTSAESAALLPPALREQIQNIGQMPAQIGNKSA